MDVLPANKLPVPLSTAWFELLRDLLLQPDKSSSDVARYLRVTRNAVIGHITRSKNNVKGRLRSVCTVEQWETIVLNCERRAQPRRYAPVPKTEKKGGVFVLPKKLPAGERGNYGRNGEKSKPPREVVKPPVEEVIEWAKDTQETLKKRMPAVSREYDTCCFPVETTYRGRSSACNELTLVRLFGGMHLVPPDIRSSFANQVRSYCVLHGHVVLQAAGRASFVRALNAALEGID